MSCGVGCRHGLDPMLLQLWRRLSATALIRLLTWEPTYVVGAALEKAKKKKRINIHLVAHRIIASCYVDLCLRYCHCLEISQAQVICMVVKLTKDGQHVQAIVPS